MKSPIKSVAACLLAATIAAGVLFFSSCGPSVEKPKYTGTSISRTAVSIYLLGYEPSSDKYSSPSYEVLDYDWLVNSYHGIFWGKMFDESITKGDIRANCTIFTEEYIAGLQRMYYRDHFHSSSQTIKLAVGEFWYLPDPNNVAEGHSVVVAITNKGPVYIEPQSRDKTQILNLTDAQIASRILRKF